MSIDSLITRNNYLGNDAVNIYNYTFKIFTENDIKIFVREISTGIETLLVLGVNYTVSGVKSKNGGQVTLLNTVSPWINLGKLKTGYEIALVRQRELKQKTDIKNQGDFFPELHEDTFDQLTMNDQYLQDQADRSIKFPRSFNPTEFNAELPTSIVGTPNKSFITNATGTGFVEGPTADEISSAQSYALNALASQNAAAASEAAALASKNAAAVSEVNAFNSATASAASATASAASATAALASQTAAATSETNAATSETNAAASATASAASAVSSATSATASQNSATASQTSATNSATSETNAAASAASSAASAATAANNAAASNWNDVVYATTGPINIVQADSSKLYSIDCTAGNVTVNLPLISGLDLTGPWSVGFIKTDSTENKIIINSNVSDAIGYGSSFELIVQNQGVVLVPDVDPTPDRWEIMKFGTTDFLRSQMFNELATDPVASISGTRKVFAKADGFYQIDSAGTVSPLGSGSGGGINLIKNGDIDGASASLFTTYIGSGSRPVTQGSGTPTDITTALTSVAPLSGTKSILFTKTGSANSQGRGAKIPFTVDQAYRAKSLKISFDYIVNSGTFTAGTNTADSDVIVYIYDLTNSSVIEPSNIKLLGSSTTLSDKYEATFQTSSTGYSYLLMLHVATTTTNNYELKLDNISVSPSQAVYGTSTTAWRDMDSSAGVFLKATTTNPTFGTIVRNKAQWRRNGENLEIDWDFRQSTAGTAGVGNYLIDISQLGLTIDTTKKMASTTIATFPDHSEGYVGSFSYKDSGGTGNGDIYAYNGTQLKIIWQYAQAATQAAGVNQSGAWTASFGALSTSALGLNARISVPITGWGATSRISDGYDGREVSFNIARTTNLTGLGPNNNYFKIPIAPNETSLDTVGGWNNSSNRYDIKTAGVYDFDLQVSISNTNVVTTNYYLVAIFKNGVRVKSGSQFLTTGGNYMNLDATAISIPCNVGDYIEAYLSGTANNSVSTLTATEVRFSGNKHQAPQTISASEKVAVFYKNSSAQNFTSNVESTVTNWTKFTDTHGSFNPVTGIFTAPYPGFYDIQASLAFGDIYGNGDRAFTIADGTTFTAHSANLTPYNVSGSGVNSKPVFALLELKAGDKICIRGVQSSTGSLTLSAVAARNYLSIKML